MEIQIQNSQKKRVRITSLRTLAQQLLQAEGRGEDTEVSILLTDDEYIRILNRDYREIDAPTDVLSFSQVEGEEIAGDGNLLGDIVISVETAQRQAKEQGHSLEEEMRMLLAHGLLHLLGYDHAEPDDERVMFERQAELLRTL